MKRLQLNSSSFKKMRQQNYLYIDKTQWIHRLLTTDSAYFFLRPRRFGKSLAVSTLKMLFQGNKALFKNLYIYDKWDFIPYPIILFDFNEISNENTEILREALSEILQEHAELHHVKIKSNIISSAFKQLIIALHKKFNQEIVILIDEYDKPIIDHIGN